MPFETVPTIWQIAAERLRRAIEDRSVIVGEQGAGSA
jgi:hypothetical protein